MTEGQVQRKLVAILAADVVGYSRLMGEDEEGTLAALKSCRDLIDPLIETHGGRIFGGAGDSVIAEFASSVEAVRCATEIQLAIGDHGADEPDEKRMRFRIGVNLGDVIIDGDDLKGDGVNVAARLEAIAPPGGVCISEAVQAQVQDRLGLDFLDLGEHRVKNIARPVRVYRVPLASEQSVVSPYRGLDIFEFEHAGLFFGRSAAIAATRERLEQQARSGTAFLLIYGMSGAGKSSLLRAGLIPALVNSGESEGQLFLRHCVFRPSDSADPITALINGLRSDTALPKMAKGQNADELAGLLRGTPQEVVSLVRSALAEAAEQGDSSSHLARLIVAADQLEEMFTAEAIGSDLRCAFVQILAELSRSGFVWVIGTIRSDFFHRCGEVEGFSELKDGLGSYELLAPTGPEIAQMIREPARAAGLKFEDDPQEGNLADVLQEAAAQHPGSLPLLGFVLDALYETGKDRRQMTFAAYRALGGLEGAIARRADEVTAGLPARVQAALPMLISALTTIRQNDETVTSRTINRDEVAANDDQNSLVEALLKARLLTGAEGVDGVAMLRIAHEALLSNWPRAREIIAANQEFLATRARVQADARRWRAEERSADLLLPSGRRLAEAEDLLLSRRDELDEALLDYVDASISAQNDRDRAEREAEMERNRLEIESAQRLAHRTRIAAIVTLVLAIIAGAGAFIGFMGQNEAEEHAALAQQSADQALIAEKEAEQQARIAEQNAEAARAAEKLAEEQAQAALVARDQALRNQSVYLADLSRRQVASGNATNGILLALEALPADMDNPNRPYVIDAEIALHEAISAHREVSVLHGHESSVRHVAYSRDGKFILSSSEDGTARIWDADSGAQRAVLRGHDGDVLTASFSPDGNRVVSASTDKTARLWDAGDGSQIKVFEGHSDTVRHALFSPDGRRIVTASDDGIVQLWDTVNAIQIGVLARHTESISAIAFSNDGKFFATASADRTIRLWNASTGVETAVIEGHKGTVRDVAFSADGKSIVTASDDETARLWSLETVSEPIVLRGHDLGVNAVEFSPDGSLVVTASFDDTARLWDAGDGTLVSILEGHERSITSLAFSAGGKYLVTASSDGTVRLWNTFSGTELAVLRGHAQSIGYVASSPIEDRSATASADGTIRIWNTGEIVGGAITLHHNGTVASAEFSPSGRLALTAAYDGSARLWDSLDGRLRATLSGHGDGMGIPNAPVVTATFGPKEQHIVTVAPDGIARIWGVETGSVLKILRGDYATSLDGRDAEQMNVASFDPDGSRIAIATGHTAGIWDVESGELIAELRGHEKTINNILYSPDGKHVITTSFDHTARIWDAESGAEHAVLVGHTLPLKSASFSADSQLVLTVSQDATARLWDAASGTEVIALKGHRQSVSHGTFSPDGSRIVTASADRTARIWTIHGETLAVMDGHEGPLFDVVFSPGGDRIVTASADFTARVWDGRTGRQVSELKGHSGFVNSVAFSPDGHRAITSSIDHRARIYRMYQTTQELIDHARSIVPRELDPCERKRFFLAVEESTGAC